MALDARPVSSLIPRILFACFFAFSSVWENPVEPPNFAFQRVVTPAARAFDLGHPRSVAMCEGRHNVLNTAEGLLATKAYRKRRNVEPYIPRKVHTRDNVTKSRSRLG
jgi:hypothetical protein